MCDGRPTANRRRRNEIAIGMHSNDRVTVHWPPEYSSSSAVAVAIARRPPTTDDTRVTSWPHAVSQLVHMARHDTIQSTNVILFIITILIESSQTTVSQPLLSMSSGKSVCETPPERDPFINNLTATPQIKLIQFIYLMAIIPQT